MSVTMLSRACSLLSLLALLLAPACGDDDNSGDDDTGMIDAGGMAVCGNGVPETGEACDDGNDIPFDGCESDCTVSTAEVCEQLTPLPSGTCAVTPGGANLLIKGDVLTPGKIYKGGQVAVDAAGLITCVGCDCAAQASGATVVTCPEGAISPGLVNAHDHLDFGDLDPHPDSGERYEHRQQWRGGLDGHTEINVSGNATDDQLRLAELRYVMGGGTTSVGGERVAGLARNLQTRLQGEQPTFLEGLGDIGRVDFDTFPLGDVIPETHDSGCSEYDIQSSSGVAATTAYLPHIAEGINQAARNEFLCTSSDLNGANDLMLDQTAIIHGIGLTASDYRFMAGRGVSLIWSPRSNVFLYGHTALVTVADREGVEIALGTDFMPSGSMNVLRELACADEFNQDYLAGYFSDEDLWRMATINGARAAAAGDKIGLLAAGYHADIAIFDASVNSGYRAVIGARPEDVALVLRGGKVLYGDAAVVDGVVASGCDALDVCGTGKKLCLMADIGMTWPQLEAATSSIYPAFSCAAVPEDEPTCVPSRPVAVNGSDVYTGAITAEDPDGDGRTGAADNCPNVFNPVRPMDGGMQGDADGDGEGDACDVCPLDANTTTCSSVDPNDFDADGVANDADNCPSDVNPGQENADGDDLGDACDFCPDTPNSGGAPCDGTIYDVKDGTLAPGAPVRITGALVTAVSRNGMGVPQGLFVQVKETDAGYMGSDFSGLFVFAPMHTAAVGNRVTVTGNVVDFFGQLEIDNAMVMVTSAMVEAPPAPVVVAPADVALGGAKATALEGVIVRVENVSVLSLGMFNEFKVTGNLTVDDLLFLITPAPIVGQSFASLTGVLVRRSSDSQLEPRGAGDVVLGAPVVTGFAPAQGFVREGQTGVPTIPTPLEVTISHAVGSDTVVTVMSGTPAALTVVGGGVTVPAGQTKATVLVNGLQQNAAVTLTATLGVSMQTATVRVLGAGEVPVVASLAPPAANVAMGGTVTFTVTLDIPAPAGGQVVALATTAGTVPAQVVVPADQLSATFDYTNGGEAMATVSATAGGVTKMSTVTLVTGATGLVINEVDYDQHVNPDGLEFVEIHNPTAAAIDLTNVRLVLVNGAPASNSSYLVFSLAPGVSLPAGGYLVVGSSAVVVPMGTIKLTFAGMTDQVQNGGTSPDGVLLLDASDGSIIDALSYEGSITAATVTGFPGTFDLVEGTALPVATADSGTVAGSLSRLPNGTDSDNAATDWNFTTTSTPGAANVP